MQLLISIGIAVALTFALDFGARALYGERLSPPAFIVTYSVLFTSAGVPIVFADLVVDGTRHAAAYIRGGQRVSAA